MYIQQKQDHQLYYNTHNRKNISNFITLSIVFITKWTFYWTQILPIKLSLRIQFCITLSNKLISFILETFIPIQEKKLNSKNTTRETISIWRNNHFDFSLFSTTFFLYSHIELDLWYEHIVLCWFIPIILFSRMFYVISNWFNIHGNIFFSICVHFKSLWDKQPFPYSFTFSLKFLLSSSTVWCYHTI